LLQERQCPLLSDGPDDPLDLATCHSFGFV
jgi:hypothetical protein